MYPEMGRANCHVLATGRRSGRPSPGERANLPQEFAPPWPPAPVSKVQIDSTPIDVMVPLDSGVRADLTISVDAATRTICAAVLRARLGMNA
jgi:putative transposase